MDVFKENLKLLLKFSLDTEDIIAKSISITRTNIKSIVNCKINNTNIIQSYAHC